MSLAAAVDEGTVDLLDGDLYAGDPQPVYAYLRAERPIYRDEINGLWGVSRYHDIVEIEKDPATWSNSGGYRPNIPADPSLIGLDDPLHRKRRSLVSRRFTPKAVTEHEPRVRKAVTGLIDAIADSGKAEAVQDLAAPLPAKMIGHLLGFPEDAWPKLAWWSESTIMLGGGPRYATDEGILSAAEFGETSIALAEERRGCPAEDLLSVWVGAEVEGCPLTNDDIASDALLLLDGGAETTRTVIANGIDALIRHPDQLDLLRREPGRIGVAVEELIRWTTPVLNMCRVATRDAEIRGQAIPGGDQLVLMYGSANRDESVFPDGQTFDVTREPNPHISFGFGSHFCLGAALARLEIRVMFEELTRRLDDWAFADDIGARRIPNAFVPGIRELPITFRAGA